MISRRLQILLVGMAVFVLAVPGGAGAEDVVVLRQHNFHVLSDNMRDIIKGLGDGLSVADMRGLAANVQAALLRVPDLLPAGSDTGKTNALPLIWSDPARFRVVYQAAATRMAELMAAAQGTDREAFGAAAGRVAAACGDCHVVFRKTPFVPFDK